MEHSPVHILGIAPYESMKATMERTAEEYPDICLDVFTGDLQAGADIVRRNLHNGYDCIISRGGTAELIRGITDIPVVEIQLSVYDILRTIKLAENYSKLYAIVGFPSITGPAYTLCDLLRYDIDILTVHNAEETYTTLSRLQEGGYRMVVSDMVTQTIARQLGMDAFLITSGIESLQAAFDQALTLGGAFRRLRQENFFLKCAARDDNGFIVVLDRRGNLSYSAAGEPGADLLTVLRTKLTEIPETSPLRFYHNDQGNLYSVTGQVVTIGQERCFLFRCVPSKIPLRTNKAGIRAFNAGECEHLLGNSFYSVSGAMGELEGILGTMAVTRQPVMITGEPGTGKEQIARYLYLHGNARNNPFVVVDCELAGDKTWDFLLNHYNSPLNDSGGTVYFQHLEQLPENRWQELLSLILDTGLSRRQRLIFSCLHPRGEELPEIAKSFDLRLGCAKLQLPALRDRTDEIPSLASLYLASLNPEIGKQISGFEPAALEKLRQFDWPYNYTQFRQVLQSLAATTRSTYISSRAVADLLAQERGLTRNFPAGAVREKGGDTLEEVIIGAIRQTLAACGGNQTAAARQLGISRTTLWRYLNPGRQGAREREART